MGDIDRFCSRCKSPIGDSIIRSEGQSPVYNFLITKFSVGDLGVAAKNITLCNNCMKLFYDFMNYEIWGEKE